MVAVMSKGHFYASFIMGVLLARYGDLLLGWLKPKSLPVKVGLLLAGVIFYNAYHFGVETHYLNLFLEKMSWLGTSAGCILILLASMASKRLQSALHMPPLIFLGRISYSVYLLQMIVILCVLSPWLHLLNSWGIFSTVWLLPLTLAASVAATVGLSTLTYRWIEVPCIELGHRLSRRLSGGKGADRI
jgi:peptidoglycan/LPS O-acetylase OafA/YrhL